MLVTGYNTYLVSHSIFRSIKFGIWAKLAGNIGKNGVALFKAMKVLKTTKSIRGAINTLRLGAVGLSGTGVGLVAGIVMFAISITLDLLLFGLINYLMDRNAIKIMPLTLRGKQYVAGIHGQRRLTFQPEEEDTSAASKVRSVRYEAIKKYLPESYRESVEYQFMNRDLIDEFYANYNSLVYGKIFTVMSETEHYLDVKAIDVNAMATEELILAAGRRITVLNTPGGDDKLTNYAVYRVAQHSRYNNNRFESDDDDGNGKLGDIVYAMLSGECIYVGGSFRASDMVQDSEIVEHNFAGFNDLETIDYSMETFFKLFQDLHGEPLEDSKWLKNFIIFQHFDTDQNMMFFSFYINMLTVEVRPADTVAAGQAIGTAGVLITKLSEPIYNTVAKEDTVNKLKKAACYFVGINKYIKEQEIIERSVITSNNILEISKNSIWSWFEQKPPTRSSAIIPETMLNIPYTVVGGSALQAAPDDTHGY
jgi:hypothetical protein